MAASNLQIEERGHLAELVLEKYAFSRLPEDQIEPTETHFLSCESCLIRLEEMETYIGMMKIALRVSQAEEARNVSAIWPSTWLRLPSLRCAAMAAALAIGVCLPVLVRNHAPTAVVSLHAYRGSENVTVPWLHRTAIVIDARGLPYETLRVKVVDAFGSEVWTGTAKIESDSARVVLPEQTRSGAYFLRLYGASSAPSMDLLREFAFNVR